MRINEEHDHLAEDVDFLKSTKADEVIEAYSISLRLLPTSDWVERLTAAIIQNVDDGNPTFLDVYISSFVHSADPEVRSMSISLIQLVIGREGLRDYVHDWIALLVKDSSKIVIRQLRESLSELIDQKSNEFTISEIFPLINWLALATKTLEEMPD
jgi:hypothetical protein